ncbi:recombinase family protein [Priestia aryabhattai]|uniref:recombinase family protein n=1 Tax=Priestia aryabhattai TaxID=412384 RepID=UPI002E250C47|nr:recombinase family protein [Priestia aryabhattai]MED3888261.1 recombinase family protein [Priestia aryabhattai]MED4262205.1 recombinase family protein [Priestia aryabhattai]
MKCIVYVRVSTDEQAKHGYSIAAQLEKLEAYCISQGWELTEKYVDEGYSAKDLHRPYFEKMMNKVKEGDVDVLLVYRLDRLTRSVMDLYKILKVLDTNNCMFKSATEVYDTTSAMGRLFITLVAAIAQWERENLGERVRLGMEKKTKLGKWKGGTPPYGYKIENKQLVINEDEQDVVKTVFELSKTLGFYTIAKQLSLKGFSTRKGGEWHVDSVRDIANNPVYAGYLTFNQNLKEYKRPPREQTLYDGNHEPLIPKEEFWQLQDILDKRRTLGGKRETSNYYFSSVLKCARCGHSLSGHKSGGKKTYRCSGKKAGKNCSSHIILEDNLVIKVFSVFDQLVKNIYGSPDVTNYSEEKVIDLHSELKSIEKLLSKQKTMYENDIIDIDELISKSTELREREKEINRELNNIKQSNKKNIEEIEFLTENMESLWEYGNDHERKQLMTTIFSQIVIDTKDEYIRGSGKPREIIIVSVK